MKVMNLLTSGGLGGIETLCREIAKCSTYDDTYVFVFGGGAVYEQMRDNGNEVFCFEDTKKLSLKKYRKLVELAKDADVIVVHHGDIFLHTYFLLLKRKYPDKKYVYTAHSSFNKSMNNKPKLKAFMMRRVMGRAIKKCDEFIAVSKAGLESYKSYYDFTKIKTNVVYNGIGKTFLETSVEKKRSDTIRLLYVGRLVNIKGIPLLINSLENLTKKHNVFLKIVGDGPQRDELENMVKDKELSKYVSFEGPQTNVIPYLKEADIFICPSTCQEIFGISIVEAMSMGNICVANRVGGIPEIISDGQNGFLTDETSSKGIEKGIEKAICALADPETIVNNAIETARRFSIDRTAEELKQVYSELIIKG